VSFFTGMMLIAFIDFLVPSYENPHEGALVEELRETGMTMACIAWNSDRPGHRHPQFSRGHRHFFCRTDGSSGRACPWPSPSRCTTSRKGFRFPSPSTTLPETAQSFLVFVSVGLFRPLARWLAYVALRPFFSNQMMGVIFAAGCGIMVFISLDQLVPHAKKYDEGHHSMYGLIGGMAVMALTLIVL